MQSVKSREDGKRLPEHLNSMISKMLSKRDMEEEKFLILGQLQSVQKSAFLVVMCQKNQKALKCQKKIPKKS